MYTLELRHDDNCGNGHNTFTMGISSPGSYSRDEEVLEKAFPEYAHMLKWHLMSTDGPMHYIPNALYWSGFTKWTEANWDYFTSTIVNGVLATDPTIDEWKDMTEVEVLERLKGRLPALLVEFQKDVEALGFTY